VGVDLEMDVGGPLCYGIGCGLEGWAGGCLGDGSKDHNVVGVDDRLCFRRESWWEGVD